MYKQRLSISSIRRKSYERQIFNYDINFYECSFSNVRTLIVQFIETMNEKLKAP